MRVDVFLHFLILATDKRKTDESSVVHSARVTLQKNREARREYAC